MKDQTTHPIYIQKMIHLANHHPNLKVKHLIKILIKNKNNNKDNFIKTDLLLKN